MDEVLESIENWASRVLPQVISCPREMVIDALQSVVVEFFKETRLWVYKDSEEVPAGTVDIDLPIPANTELVDIESIRINGVHCTAGSYTHDFRTVHLKNMLNAKACITFELVLRPSRFCDLVPRRLMEEYGDTIVFGAIAKLKTMSSGSDGTIKWSDPEAGKLNYELYQNGLNAAKLRAQVIRGYGIVKTAW